MIQFFEVSIIFSFSFNNSCMYIMGEFFSLSVSANCTLYTSGFLGTYKGKVEWNYSLSTCKEYQPFAPVVRLAIFSSVLFFSKIFKDLSDPTLNYVLIVYLTIIYVDSLINETVTGTMHRDYEDVDSGWGMLKPVGFEERK